MSENKEQEKQNKLDKRAMALRANLKKRKDVAKSKVIKKKETTSK